MKVNKRLNRGTDEIDTDLLIENLKDQWEELQEVLKSLPVQKVAVIEHFNNIEGVEATDLGKYLYESHHSFAVKLIGVDDDEKKIWMNAVREELLECEGDDD